MCFTRTWVRYARSGSGLKVKTLVQLFRKAVGDSVCLISSSVSRCYQSRLLYFLWGPDWVWPFCRGARGLYESFEWLQSVPSVGCTDFSGFSLQGLPTCAGHRMATEETRSGKQAVAQRSISQEISCLVLSCTPYREGKPQLFALSLTFLESCFCL